MSLPSSDALTSIIIPCWNQIEFTRVCLSALVRHTRPRWELIVIDNGSSDGSGTYLAGVQDAVPVPVTVVSNARNLGFPAVINQGLKAARGDYLVLLNNDAVVTDAWLDQLIALAEIDSQSITKETNREEGWNACRQRPCRGARALDRPGSEERKTESATDEHGFTRMVIRHATTWGERRGWAHPIGPQSSLSDPCFIRGQKFFDS